MVRASRIICLSPGEVDDGAYPHGMQTILGANGQIGTELARALHDQHTTDLRLVSRSPKSLHQSDQVLSADLMDADATSRAVEGSEIAYLTVGLPPNSCR